MLFRGSNAVGYSAYPDNLIEKFVEKSSEAGIDVFRIFDSLNWIEAMKVSIKAVRKELLESRKLPFAIRVIYIRIRNTICNIT